MGSEQILKKSILGGFKKEGVLNYIEQLQSEILSLKKEVNENSDCKMQLENVMSEKDSADIDIIALTKENEQLKNDLSDLQDEKSTLIEANTELNVQIQNAKNTIAELEEKQKKWEEKVALIEEKFAEIESSYSKIGETDNKVNGMLNDAKSYSDRIISDAKLSASAISEKTAEAVNIAKSEILSANDRIQTACVNFDSSAASLKACTENLINILSEISESFSSVSSKDE